MIVKQREVKQLMTRPDLLPGSTSTFMFKVRSYRQLADNNSFLKRPG